MSETVTPGAAEAASPIIHRCPHCGRRDTSKRIGAQFVPVSRVTVTTWACTRCGFRWVSLQRKLADETASGTTGKGAAE